jgi:hypothetical protein
MVSAAFRKAAAAAVVPSPCCDSEPGVGLARGDCRVDAVASSLARAERGGTGTDHRRGE